MTYRDPRQANNWPLKKAFTGATPFNDKPSCMAISAIANGERPPRPTHFALTEGLWDLTQQCWYQNPHLRPKASDLRRCL